MLVHLSQLNCVKSPVIGGGQQAVHLTSEGAQHVGCILATEGLQRPLHLVLIQCQAARVVWSPCLRVKLP